jgi:tetratricopeptide (TPR) repeat protein
MTARDPGFPVITPRSSTAAYRIDLAGRDGSFGPHDGAWVAVASLLEHAALLPEPDRSRLLVDAIEFAREIIGDAELARLGEREWQDTDRTPAEAIILLAESLHRTGAMNLAGAMLDALLVADTSLNDVQRGRIVAQRARALRKLGLLEEADWCSKYVGQLGRNAKNVELQVRELLGFSASAQMRGNYPEVHRHSERARQLAESAGLKNLTRDACVGLMIALATTGRFDEALVHGWQAYQSSIGDSIDEGEVLHNLANLLLEAGHFAEARAGFAAIVSSQRPAYMILPALGGLAIASAATGQAEVVEWAAAEIERLAATPALRFPIASALLEAAIGLQRIGRREAAERCRIAALELGRANKFHEIVFRAEAMPSNVESSAIRHLLTREAATVASEVAWLEPKQLPEHVALAVASS